jgi:hypothetical protein
VLDAGRDARYCRAMRNVLLVVLCLLAAACTDRRGWREQYQDERRAERCDILYDEYKNRVRRFEHREHRNKESFRRAKEDLLRDLARFDTSVCGDELGDDIEDLIEDVVEERY